MARLIACPSCRRHVLATEHDCPFCGRVGLTTAAPGRLSVLLLGLCLAGCAGAKDDAKTDAKAGEKAGEGQKADTPEPAPEPTPQPATPEPNDTEVAPPEQPEQPEGTDGGAAIDEPPKADDNPPKVKYGGPRPTKKYGAPPKPDSPMPG